MKVFRLISACVIMLLSFTVAQAQVDVKINPIGLLFRSVNGSVEFGVKENFGIELTAGASWPSLKVTEEGPNGDEEQDVTGTLLRVGTNARYYFNPSKGLDRFYVGAYGRYGGGKLENRDRLNEELTYNRLALGFLFGTKIVARNERLLFDFGIGFGRALLFQVEDSNGNQEDLSDVEFLNWDIPIHVAIGYRF